MGARWSNKGTECGGIVKILSKKGEKIVPSGVRSREEGLIVGGSLLYIYLSVEPQTNSQRGALESLVIP